MDEVVLIACVRRMHESKVEMDIKLANLEKEKQDLAAAFNELERQRLDDKLAQAQLAGTQKQADIAKVGDRVWNHVRGAMQLGAPACVLQCAARCCNW